VPDFEPLALLDLDGNVTETSGSNFLVAKHGALISPTARNTMRGIRRRNVICVRSSKSPSLSANNR